MAHRLSRFRKKIGKLTATRCVIVWSRWVGGGILMQQLLQCMRAQAQTKWKQNWINWKRILRVLPRDYFHQSLLFIMFSQDVCSHLHSLRLLFATTPIGRPANDERIQKVLSRKICKVPSTLAIAVCVARSSNRYIIIFESMRTRFWFSLDVRISFFSDHGVLRHHRRRSQTNKQTYFMCRKLSGERLMWKIWDAVA